jgi:hypothetical protein
VKVYLQELMVKEKRRPTWWRDELPSDLSVKSVESIVEGLRSAQKEMDEKPIRRKFLTMVSYHFRVAYPTPAEEREFRTVDGLALPVAEIRAFTFLGAKGWGVNRVNTPFRFDLAGNGEEQYVIIKETSAIQSHRVERPEDRGINIRDEVDRILKSKPPQLSLALCWSFERSTKEGNNLPEVATINVHFRMVDAEWRRVDQTALLRRSSPR